MARINADSLVGNRSQGIYNAHYGSTANVSFGISDETRAYSGSLFAKGIMLGKVEHVTTKIVSGIVPKECLEMIKGIAVDDRGQIQSISESIWRILCANRNADGGPMPPIYRMVLFHLLQGSRGVRSIDTGELFAEPHPKHVVKFLKRVQAFGWNRRVCRSSDQAGLGKELVGLAP
ncbi:hypothetical protein SCUP515_10912 [Seiridium cupressi]